MQLLSTLHHRSHAAACGGEPPHAPIPVCDTCNVMAGKKPPKRSASRRRLPGSSASCRCVGYCVCYVRLTLLVHRCRAASQCWRPTLLWVWCVWCICLLQEAEESKQLDDLKNTKKDKKLKKKITGAGAGRRPVGAGHSVAGSSASGGGSVGGDLFSLDELQDLSGTNQARLPPMWPRSLPSRCLRVQPWISTARSTCLVQLAWKARSRNSIATRRSVANRYG